MQNKRFKTLVLDRTRGEVYMPPKAKFSRNEIVDAALDIVRTDGFQR